jgi:SAM-dependent methyltransferase
MPIATVLRQMAKATLPRSIMGRMRLAMQRRHDRGRSREDVFTEVYAKGMWGKSEDGISSGPGSVAENFTQYVDFVSEFVATHGIKSVVDFGCGDFQVGRRLRLGDATYLGCDIVRPVIERNSGSFSSKSVSFRHFDLLGDEPYPNGELCLIRQVLQHFSNAAVTKVLQRVQNYPYVLLTDAIMPGDAAVENYDIDTSHLSRTIFGSGLRLELPPFSAPIEPVLEYPYALSPEEKSNGYPQLFLRTVLLRQATRRN